MKAPQVAVGLGTIGLAALLGAGATQIGSDAGYSGVGPAFLPRLVAATLGVCGALLVREALTGGFRGLDDAGPAGAVPAHWRGFAWVSAGIVLNAALITTIGFVLGCMLTFVLAVRGFRDAQGTLDLGLRAWVADAAIGFAIAAPVYWMFTKLLAIGLPGVTGTGWL